MPAPETGVLISGDGVAASCCEFLLGQAGLPFLHQERLRPKVPAVMLSQTAQHLFKDVFQSEDLFDGLTRVRRRIVRWGRNTPSVAVLPHSAIVAPEELLLARIASKTRPCIPPLQTNWTVFATRPLPEPSRHIEFGSRIAAASAITLKTSADDDTCWIESLENGWLFLLPCGERRGWLLSVGAPVQTHLSASRLIAEQIADSSDLPGGFPSHPRLAFPLCGPAWLACGSAALAFDPLCGDGATHALREAILGVAVIRATEDKGDPQELLKHYETRMLAGFARHLQVCHEFYASGHSGDWWEIELNALREGLRWCSQRLEQNGATFKYQLNGFTLTPV